MANKNGQWGCAKGDKVKHFYCMFSSEYIPACDPNDSQSRILTKGGNKSKCKACVSALSVS